MGLPRGFLVTIRQIGKKTGSPASTPRTRAASGTSPVRLHGRHQLNRYEDGMEKCIGCELCAGVCPARCIYVRGEDNPPDAPVSPGERYGFVYEINYLRCIHCDLCVEACPTEAITETKLFEFSFPNRADAIYTKDELLVDDDGLPQRMPWEDWTDSPRSCRHSSAWMRATAVSGDASYEGKVAWSGELGFGVQAAERWARRRHRGGRDGGEGPLMEAPFFIVAVIVLGARSGSSSPQPGALRAQPGRDPVRHRRAVHRPGRHFLAAVQVIVYAGAIVVLFLFVIMLLGVDRADDLDTDPLVGQHRSPGHRRRRCSAPALAAVLIASTVTGMRGGVAPVDPDGDDIDQIGRLLFTDYLFAFEITSVLLVIAVVGAVLLARHARRPDRCRRAA